MAIVCSLHPVVSSSILGQDGLIFTSSPANLCGAEALLCTKCRKDFNNVSCQVSLPFDSQPRDCEFDTWL